MSIESIMEGVDEQMGKPMSRRGYLGGSSLGKECPRQLWLDWRWCNAPLADARLARIFALGHQLEDNIAEFIRKSPKVRLITHERGEQIGGSFFGGHLRYHIDGLLTGADGKTYLWECKTANNRRFNRLNKLGTQAREAGETKNLAYSEWDETYSMQVHFYGGALKEQYPEENINGAYITVYDKNTSAIYSEQMDLDEIIYNQLKDKAWWLLNLKEPPQAAYSKSAFQVKNFMDDEERGIYLGELTPLNPLCRTCKFSRPNLSDKQKRGQWGCTRTKTIINHKQQLKGCLDHEWIPGLVPAKHLGNNKYEKNDVVFYNVGASNPMTEEHSYTSSEIAYLCRNDFNFEDNDKITDARKLFDVKQQLEVTKNDNNNED
tara:strand:- start:603 stop:1730 length:1128 start_codon:yes stop_codon:yes gene_type:complete